MSILLCAVILIIASIRFRLVFFSCRFPPLSPFLFPLTLEMYFALFLNFFHHSL
uniref:PH domain-containing protein n=1 Tax=Parascaris univalens TaxID=6257 RepID=A0A915A8R9_PARUN